MAARLELEKLKKLLQKSIEKSDTKGFMRHLEKFYDQYKNVLKPEENDVVHELLAKIRRSHRPRATFHEFILFIIVLALVIFVFGERFLPQFDLEFA